MKRRKINFFKNIIFILLIKIILKQTIKNYSKIILLFKIFIFQFFFSKPKSWNWSNVGHQPSDGIDAALRAGR